MTGKFENILEKGEVIIFSIYIKIIHYQTSFLLLNDLFAEAHWKG